MFAEKMQQEIGEMVELKARLMTQLDRYLESSLECGIHNGLPETKTVLNNLVHILEAGATQDILLVLERHLHNTCGAVSLR